MILYRPVGEKEYLLIEKSDFKKFPPRLPEQPIFYPVLFMEYAMQIASIWNIKDKNSNYKGYVLKFEIDDEYASTFKVQTVGGEIHKEFWVDSSDMDIFNSHIIGDIKLIAEYKKKENS